MCCSVTEGGWCKGSGETRGRVQSMVHPEMKWIIECGINTANNLGSPPFRKKEKLQNRE